MSAPPTPPGPTGRHPGVSASLHPGHDNTMPLPSGIGPPPPPELPLPPPAPPEPAPVEAGPPASPRRALWAPGWPLAALITLYPVWWAVGLTPFLVMLVALPMGVQLYGRRPVRLPPGFAFWILGVAWTAASGIMLSQQPPHALPATSGAYVAFVLRLLNYLALTVILLYIGNLTERELPRLRIVRMLSVFFLVTVAGGIAGLLYPEVTWRTPVLRLAEQVVPGNDFVTRLFTVGMAQVQRVLGTELSVRPAAPFEYTNTWGYVLSLTLVWFVLGWWVYGGRRRRFAVPLILAVAVVPVVYSLNRGLWIGLGLTLLFLGVMLSLRGRVAPLFGLVVVGTTVTAVFLASPLSGLVEERLASGHSDTTRAALNADAVEAALSSPILGYGGPRSGLGSEQSIAVGPTDQCPQCGSRTIGSDGHFWFLLISQGFVGAFAFIAWLLRMLWVYRRDSTPLGAAGQLGLLLPLFYMFVYPSLVMPLALTVIAAGLLWRNAGGRRGADVAPA